MGGQNADPGEKQELARNALDRRVEKTVLDVEVPNREGPAVMWPHYKAEHMAYVDGPRLARVLDSVLIGSLAVICPACWCSRI